VLTLLLILPPAYCCCCLRVFGEWTVVPFSWKYEKALHQSRE
jgi:hypothetical protein